MRKLAFFLIVMGLSLPDYGAAQAAAQASAHTGTYTLVAIDGNELPYTPSHVGGAPEIRSSTLTVDSDGTFTATMTYGMPSGDVISRDFSGTYTREGSIFSLQWTGAGRTSATLEGSTLTMDNEGMLFSYRK
jgi:hypothetical protein